jgi:hypothetical protein
VALEDVEALLARRKRNVEMRVDGPPPSLDGVAGVSGFAVRADGLVTCHLEGEVGPFLAAIRDVRVIDLTIEPAHLEEAFLELYHDEVGDEVEVGEASPPAAPPVAPGPPEASA